MAACKCKFCQAKLTTSIAYMEYIKDKKFYFCNEDITAEIEFEGTMDQFNDIEKGKFCFYDPYYDDNQLFICCINGSIVYD